MTYMLLIVEPTEQRQTRSEAEGRELYASMLQFGEDLKSKGLFLGSESLRSQSDAARVQVRGNKAVVIDGPFAETKEMIGGFFLLNCETKAEAIAIAKECPAALWCTVEVRELAPCYM
jgi:hypothetical protein